MHKIFNSLSFQFFLKWESIDYFHNKIICDLIEQKPMCIIDILVRGKKKCLNLI